MNKAYDWYSILTAPAMYALISALVLTLRFSYFGSIMTYEDARQNGTLLWLASVISLAIILLVFPFKIGYRISEDVESKKLLQGILGSLVYSIVTFIASFAIIIITLEFTNSPYVIAETFAFGITPGSALASAFVFLLISICSAFVGAFKQTKSKNQND